MLKVDRFLYIESVYLTKTLKEKRLKADFSVIREIFKKKEIQAVNWCPRNT